MKFPISNFQFPNKKPRKTKNILFNNFYRALSILALFLILSVLMPSLTLNPVTAASQTDVDNLAAQIKELTTQLNTKKADVKTFADEVAIYDGQIQKIQLEINATQAQIDLATSKITNLNDQIQESELKLAKHKEILKEYIKVLYEQSNTSTLEMIAESNNFSDFVDRTEYLETMQLKTKQIVEEVKKLKGELSESKNNVEKSRQEIASLEKTQLSQKADLDRQRYSKQLLLTQSKGQATNIQSVIAKKEEEKSKVENLLKNPPPPPPSATAPVYSPPAGGSAQPPPQSHGSVPQFYQNQGWWAWIGINDSQRPSGAQPSYMAYLGCKITSLAMIMNYYGRGVDPGTIAQNPAYFASGWNWDLLYWGGVQASSGLPIDKSYSYTKGNQWASVGKPFIASGDIFHIGYDHSVVITGRTQDGRWIMNDPIQGPNLIFPLSPSQITDYVFVN